MPREMRAMQTEIDDIQTLKSEMAEIRLKIGINQELMDRNKKLDDTAQALHQTIQDRDRRLLNKPPLLLAYKDV
ncbi:hypothetical protein VKS41_004762 [Umbelopsis sp. WA50703]